MDEETEGNTCNCDANLPIPSFDEGTITNITALPITKMSFGGLSYDLQYAAFTLGRLKCFGARPIAMATSCSALKMTGVTQSGYYHIKGEDDVYAALVFCDMQSGTYTDVPQLNQPSRDSPIGTILAWVKKPEDDLESISSLPDGWVPCDGSIITQGPWSGGKTPDLNGGHFLRGGNDEELLSLEEDQVQDHQHLDNGHSHSASSTSPSHSHSYHDTWIDVSISNRYCETQCPGHYSGGTTDTLRTSNSASVPVSTTVSSHTSGLTGVSSAYRAGSETRPRNMRVQWIMRCW